MAGGGQGGEIEGKGHRELFGVSWDNFTGVLICQNTSKCAGKMCSYDCI